MIIISVFPLSLLIQITDRKSLGFLIELDGVCQEILTTSEYIVEPLFDKPGILYAEINPDLIAEGRLFLDTDGHYSRPDIFRLEVNTRPQSNVYFTS